MQGWTVNGNKKILGGNRNVLYLDCGGGILELIKLYASNGCTLLLRNYIPMKLI